MVDDNSRCRGCGGRIERGQTVMKVAKGTAFDLDEDVEEFEEGDVWGYMHQQCFLLAIGDPDALFSLEPAAAA